MMQLMNLNEMPWQPSIEKYKTKSVVAGLALQLIPEFSTVQLMGSSEKVLLVLRGRGRAWVKKALVPLSGGILITKLKEVPVTIKTEDEELLLMEMSQSLEDSRRPLVETAESPPETATEPETEVEPAKATEPSRSEVSKPEEESAEEHQETEPPADTPPSPWPSGLWPPPRT